MYPRNYFGLFPAFPRENKVFVAMSFDERFNRRWEKVIEPAIRSVPIGGVPLEPHRVDARKIGDSILTEILGGITNDRVIFADVTTFAHVGDTPIRNGNVMYEIGLAHAVRLPEEVLIFRSDSDRLLFDLANVRVNSYNPDDEPEKAKATITAAILECVNELDLRRNLAVKAVAKSLDLSAQALLYTAIKTGRIKIIPTKLHSAKNDAIIRLLEVGALETTFTEVRADHVMQSMDDSDFISYEVTEFGRAVAEYGIQQITPTPQAQALFVLMRAAMTIAADAKSQPSGGPEAGDTPSVSP